jgi:hypothetical protein
LHSPERGVTGLREGEYNTYRTQQKDNGRNENSAVNHKAAI